MSILACTLFEGDYHHGLAALVNSLCRNGYQGAFWAGYKGQLPAWASPLVANEGYQTHHVTDFCSINFVSLDHTSTHMAWLKPDFMLDLLDRCPEATGIVYIDPDIVIDAYWSYFVECLSFGVTLCADKVRIPATHPLRQGWKRECEQRGFNHRAMHDVYVNSGFVGVPRSSSGLLHEWKSWQSIESMVGTGHPAQAWPHNRVGLFPLHDQDCLNATLSITQTSITVLGPDAMAFKPGYPVMYHAVGPSKPWSRNILRKRSYDPIVTEKFLFYSDRPIRAVSSLTQLVSPLGRFRSYMLRSIALLLLAGAVVHYA